MAMNQDTAAPAACHLSRDEWGRLRFDDPQGQAHVGVSVVPLFPISEAKRWIAILDASGRELICLPDLAEYPADFQALVLEELALRDFVPRIQRVVSVSGNSEPCEWVVDTNHGRTRFVLKAEDDIRRLSPHEVLILDANGGRYRVDDTRQLDARSRRFIEWYV